MTTLTQIDGIFGKNLPKHLKGTPIHTAMQMPYLYENYTRRVAGILLPNHVTMEAGFFRVHEPVFEHYTDISFDYEILNGERGKINIELKPVMANNWPQVLRQIHAQRDRMKRNNPFNMARNIWFLQLGTYEGNDPFGLVKQAFLNSQINIFFTAEVETRH